MQSSWKRSCSYVKGSSQRPVDPARKNKSARVGHELYGKPPTKQPTLGN